jgi:D-alanyl-D-alanine carboxypeptidase
MLTTILLRFVDQGKLSLSDKLSKWYPNLPNADKITMQMLADSTTGYNDFVTTSEFNTALHADPFRQFRVPDLLAIAMSKPPLFEPGTTGRFRTPTSCCSGRCSRRSAASRSRCSSASRSSSRPA